MTISPGARKFLRISFDAFSIANGSVVVDEFALTARVATTSGGWKL